MKGFSEERRACPLCGGPRNVLPPVLRLAACLRLARLLSKDADLPNEIPSGASRCQEEAPQDVKDDLA